MEFDFMEFANAYDIPIRRNTKNVGSGWIGVEECPFCGIDRYHFAVNLQSKGYSCWGCLKKGSALTLVSSLLNVPKYEAMQIIQKFTNIDLEFNIRETGDKVILPSDIQELGAAGRDYLAKRNFRPYELERLYKLQQTGMASYLNHAGQESDFRWRILIPIYMNRRLVSYTARDYTGQRDPRYRHPFLEACIIPPSSCIYNIDTVKNKRAIIVEGPSDVWRMGSETISLQGIKYTKEQIRYLAEMELDFVAVMYDAGKEEEAHSLANEIAPFSKTTKVISLDEGDPGDLSPSEAVKIKYQIFQR